MPAPKKTSRFKPILKRLFFFDSLLTLGGFLFVFLLVLVGFLLAPKKKMNNLPQLSERLFEKEIKSSCRTAPQKLVSKSNLNRMQKLDHLMDTAVDWVFTDLKGEVIDFYCLRGEKKLVLNFWATWCPPCIKELSSLAQLAKNNKDKIFVVAVSIEDQSIVQNFLARSFSDLDSNLKVAVVSEDEKLKYFPKDSLPATYVFNTKGLLKMKELGDKDWSDKNIVQFILSLD